MVPLSTQDLNSIAKKLEMDVRQGKHTTARLVVNGVVVVSTSWSHGKKEIPKGTANKILKHQFFLDTNAQGFALRDCAMKRPDYLEVLRSKRVIP